MRGKRCGCDVVGGEGGGEVNTAEGGFGEFVYLLTCFVDFLRS